MTTTVTTHVDTGTAQYATFFLDGLYFGIEVLSVQEVIRHQRVVSLVLPRRRIEVARHDHRKIRHLKRRDAFPQQRR